MPSLRVFWYTLAALIVVPVWVVLLIAGGCKIILMALVWPCAWVEQRCRAFITSPEKAVRN